MTYVVWVLLPGSADWPELPYVDVHERTSVDDDMRRHLSSADDQLQLAVHGEDDVLEERLVAVGRLALDHHGIALDGRALTPLLPVASATRHEEPRDPGPVWEHLPDVGRVGPATGAVVDAQPAIAHLESAVVDPGEQTPYEPDLGEHDPGGVWIWWCTLGLVRARARRFAVACLACAAAGWATGSLEAGGPVVLIPVLLAAVLVPVALIPADGPYRNRLASLVAAATVVVLLIDTVSLVPVVGPYTWLVSPLLLAVPAALWAGMTWHAAITALWRLSRSRWPSLLASWVLLVGWPLGVLVALLLGLVSGWSYGDAPRDYAASIGAAAYAVALCFTTAMARVARDARAG